MHEQDAPTKTERTTRAFEGQWIDEGYEFIDVGAQNGWRSVSAWGRDGWDLGDWPYVVYLFRDVAGTFQRADYCEGDITIETYATAEARERATDTTAAWYWRSRGEDWIAAFAEGAEPLHLRGPYSRSRAEEVTA